MPDRTPTEQHAYDRRQARHDPDEFNRRFEAGEVRTAPPSSESRERAALRALAHRNPAEFNRRFEAGEIAGTDLA